MAAPTARLQPVERRRALATVIDVWRDLGRDLAIAAHGDGRGVRDRDLLTELRAVATRIDQGALRRFLDRLDRLERGALVRNAALVASLAYYAANLSERLPRKPLPEPDASAAGPWSPGR